METVKACQISWSDIHKINQEDYEQRASVADNVGQQRTDHPESGTTDSVQLGKLGDTLVMIHPFKNIFGNTSVNERSRILSDLLQLS